MKKNKKENAKQIINEEFQELPERSKEEYMEELSSILDQVKPQRQKYFIACCKYLLDLFKTKDDD